MIQISKLSKSYGRQVLFDSAAFSINAGERIGLVGRNGHGKTTLFRILAGIEEPDDGEIHFPTDYKIGYLSQHLAFSAPSVLEEAAEVLPLRDGTWKETYRAEAVLHGLGFDSEAQQRPPSDFSGGFQVRLHLAKLLLSEPNLLLLDEPTNYLDILALRWLVDFLQAWPQEAMLITHDRAFMDSVCTHTVGIHRRAVRKIEGSTEKFYEQLALEEEVQEKSRLNQEKQIKDTEDFIRRFRAKASKAKAVQSRVKALERMDTVEKLDEIADLDFRFRYQEFHARRLLSASDLAFHYPEQDAFLLEGLSFTVKPSDRIAVVGRNGKGKSTLLRLVAGELSPVRGEFTVSPNLTLGYFGQTNVDRLDPGLTIEETLLEVSPTHNRTEARSIAGLMMFEGDAALKKVKVLSGGEKARVLLGKLLLTPSNMLLLDEPSNHLDMQSTDSLLEAMKEFPGAVLFVTHSEMFLRELATRLIVFDSGKAELFEGTYEEFLRRRGWSDERDQNEEPKPETPTLSKKELRKLRAEVNQRRSDILGPLRKQAEAAEEEIALLETAVEEGNKTLIEASKDGFGDAEAKLSRELGKQQVRLEELYAELEELLSAIEERQAEFDRELAGIG